jgi:hypothetical protein
MGLALTDAEREQIKKLIDAGEPLPERYRSELFAEPQGVELIWPGKTQEVTTAVLPFQSIEQIDEPRSEAGTKGISMDLFSLAPGGRQHSGWTNKLIWGDNKLVLSSLANGPLRREIEDAGGLKLVYIDPPFDVGADFSFEVEVGENYKLSKQASVIEELAYRDTWGRGTDSYVAMIFERLLLIRSLMATTGSILLHVGANVSHLVRLCMDECFGMDNHRNEIILPGRATKNLQQQFDSIQKLQVRHDVLLWYTREPNVRFVPYWIEKHDAGNPEGHWHHFWSTADRPTMRYELFGITPTSGQWTWQESRALVAVNNYLRFLDEAGGRTLAEYWRDTGSGLEFVRQSPDDGKPQYWREPAESRLGDSVWSGVPIYSSTHGFPTEKNERFLTEVLNLSSNPGDLVADFFCGSGTTLAVAEKLGRKWIGCDLGRFAIHTTRKRLIGVQRELKAAGKPYRAFEIMNLGKYERQYFSGINPNLSEDEKRELAIRKEEQYIGLILAAYKAERVWQSPPFHGKHRDSMVVVGPMDAPVTQSLLHEAVAGARKLRVTKVDILGFDFEMNLVPFEVDVAREKGVSVQLRYIPRDVFDKRAVDKGQVKFYDVAYVEVKARVDGKRVVVELADFGVHYRQDDTAEKLEKLKPGASKVIVKNGQVVKVTRRKPEGAGPSARPRAGTGAGPFEEWEEEVLTKQWTDWIDYWAVDFDYFTRPEQVRIIENGVERSVYTGNYLFENEWQSFRTRKDRKLELQSAWHEYDLGGMKKTKKTIAVKVIDIFGNDTTKAVEVWINAAR